MATLFGFLIGLEGICGTASGGAHTRIGCTRLCDFFALVSLAAFPGSGSARVAAGVVTGLGFLGAGMILKQGDEKVYGLTTAAGIWAVGGIGLAIGAGLYLLGTSSAILVGLLLGLERVLKIDQRLAQRKQKERKQ